MAELTHNDYGRFNAEERQFLLKKFFGFLDNVFNQTSITCTFEMIGIIWTIVMI